jgi:hypothetical protein
MTWMSGTTARGLRAVPGTRNAQECLGTVACSGRVVQRAAGIVCASFGADGGLLGAWLVLYRYEVVEVEDARLES